MTIGIPREIHPGESRVAITPEVSARLRQLGFTVLVESGAGEGAHFADSAYQQAGCQIVADPTTLWQSVDIMLKVRPPEMHPDLDRHEADLLADGGTLISFIWAAQNPQLLEQLAARRATVFAMEQVPRITRAQSLDALSSMANLAGYRAVIEAANHFGRLLGGQITAAGKILPAKVLVIGAGVAGLAAIATAKGLGAIVRAFDTRAAVKEQVQSLGAEFLELDFAEEGAGTGGYARVMSPAFIEAEMALFAAQARDVDIILTTALIPGKPAPKLISTEMAASMRPGSVIVDLAAEQGGNCALTQPGSVHRHQGVTIVGLTNYPSLMAQQASQLYGNNLYHLLEELGSVDPQQLDLENEIVRAMLVLQVGEKPQLPPLQASQPPAGQPTQSAPTQAASAHSASGRVPVTTPNSKAASEHTVPQPSAPRGAVEVPGQAFSAAKAVTQGSSSGLPGQQDRWLLLAGLGLVGVGSVVPVSFLSHLMVFVLACFIGWQVIWNVKPALHTPLMSVTNAISGIIILGGMLQLTGEQLTAPMLLGAMAIFVGTINIAGGFLVTQRMLGMFKK